MSAKVWVVRTIAIAVLVPLVGLYLYPRIANLVATPYRLDEAVVHGNRYNPALAKIVDEEKVTLTGFTALDQMDSQVAQVRNTDARVSGELKILIRQIRGDLQSTLNKANSSVGGLVGSLDRLEARIRDLNPPVDGATDAVSRDRQTLSEILSDARSTAAKVHMARQEADRAAHNVSGS